MFNRRTTVYYLLELFIIVIGIIAGVFLAMRQSQEIKDELIKLDRVLALSISAQEIESLQGDASDLQNPNYAKLKALLMQAAGIETEARFVYIFGQKPDGRLFFYADNEPADSSDYSPPGQIYEQASPQDFQIFKDGQPQVFSSIDKWGRWISVEVPIVDEASGRIVASMNLDIPQQRYYQQIFSIGAMPILISIIFVLLLFSIRRISQKDEQLINQRAAYLSITAHDLKTPLTAIKWIAEGTKESLPMPENQLKENLENISKSSQEMFSFIDDLTSASKADAGKIISDKKERIDIGEMTKKVVENMRLFIKEKKLILECNVVADVDVIGDMNSLRRALANLISNAIKYSSEGGLVRISVQKEEKKVIWEISDNGIGIPKEEQEEVLSGYYRAKNAKRSAIPGTGLGLYYVKKVVEAHHGNLTLFSEIDKGTKITITLPLSEKE
ncbi:MAG: HAMP domain-containing sensor histidine kinase [Candidatus Paceibacterota bacterium]